MVRVLKIYCVVIDFWKIFSYNESLLFSAKFQALSNHNPSIEAHPGMFFLIIRAGLPVTVQKTFHVQYIFVALLEGMEYFRYDVMTQLSAIRSRTFLRLT